jgi:hypothetical protein
MSDDHESYKDVPIFTAPTGGYYRIACEVTTMKPTGRFETVLNPERKWWKFWLSKTVTREVYETIQEANGSMVAYLKAGEHTKLGIIERIR